MKKRINHILGCSKADILSDKHNFDFDNVKTLAFESEWRRRIIKESILTNRTLGKSINETKHITQVIK
jgi:hypothetical protein